MYLELTLILVWLTHWPCVCSSTHLYPAVAPVCHNDVAVDVHSHSSGSVKLTVAFTVGAEFQQKFTFSVEHLHDKDATHHHHLNRNEVYHF